MLLRQNNRRGRRSHTDDRRGRRSYTGRRSRAGYILFETLVAVAVLSVGALAANKAIYQASLVRSYARDATQARFLLTQLMSDIELKPLLMAGTTRGAFGNAFPGFRWECAVTLEGVRPPVVPRATGTPSVPASHYTARQLGKVRVVVLWSRSGRDFIETLETLIPPDRIVVPIVKKDATFFGKTKRK